MKKEYYWLTLISVLVILISILHYTTPTMKWQYHLIYMQAYFIPILIGAFQFGIRGGLGTAAAVSVLYFPHIMFHWGGLVEGNLMRFVQIILFNIIGYLTGLKAQKEMEENSKFRQANIQLNEKLDLLKQRDEKISEMEEQLRQADRLAIVGELTASLAHEIRNPLASIQGATEIIKDECTLSEKQYEFLNILLTETERLNQVVSNYLHFSHKQDKQISRLDIRKIIEDSVFMLQKQAAKKNIRLKTQLPQADLIVKTDRNQLWQILMNLLINAIQAMEHGGEIQVSVETDNNHLIISVADQGPGIPESISNDVFKPFFTTKLEGTGLGLAIVKRIADSYNWQVSFEPNTPNGTIIKLKMEA